MLDLVLASGSTYRRELLARLQLPFVYAAPYIDEEPQPGESAEELTLRLAEEKADSLCTRYANHLIIGSDQVLILEGSPVSKPGNHQAAVDQLTLSSGKTVRFITSLCLLNSATGRKQLAHEYFEVEFRQLDQLSIERYLRQEKPYDCAGSFKAEGMGISLFKSMRGDDPTSLIGLPLIRLCDMLNEEGIAVP